MIATISRAGCPRLLPGRGAARGGRAWTGARFDPAAPGTATTIQDAGLQRTL